MCIRLKKRFLKTWNKKTFSLEVSRNDSAGVWRARARPALKICVKMLTWVMAKPCACSIKSWHDFRRAFHWKRKALLAGWWQPWQGFELFTVFLYSKEHSKSRGSRLLPHACLSCPRVLYDYTAYKLPGYKSPLPSTFPCSLDINNFTEVYSVSNIEVTVQWFAVSSSKCAAVIKSQDAEHCAVDNAVC